jgi:outer membrane protein assembly factor BamC
MPPVFLETLSVIVRSVVMRFAVLGCVSLVVAACSSVESFVSGDKIDYKGQSAKTAPLDVPPDLSQLARDSRYQPQGGVISASGMQANVGAAPAAGAASAPAAVAPSSVGDMRIERDGNLRWLVSPIAPDDLFPQVRSFWIERGFNLPLDDAKAGVMETDWAENRAKIPTSAFRSMFGGFLDPFFGTGERDRFRTRIERTPTGSEVYITHRGVEEYMSGNTKDLPVWRNRPSDPQLEAEMLVRLMAKLGAKPDTGRTQAAVPAGPAARARVMSGEAAATLEFDEGYDRAWRRVGLALDRSGFTVEDRDRSGGLYFVRYVDPKYAGREEPNFFSKLFSSDKDKASPQRYRIALKRAGEKTQVAVQTSQGSPENGETGQRIVALLVDELK